MRTAAIVATALLVFAVADASAQGVDPNLARNLAATCANCHGPGGASQGGTASLAGMPRDAMIRRMQEFKAGNPPATTIMPQLAKGYTDEQIALIAGWFAAQMVPQ